MLHGILFVVFAAVVAYFLLRNPLRRKKIWLKIKTLAGFVDGDGLKKGDVESLHDYERLSAHLKPLSFDPETMLFYNDDETLGFCFLIEPKPGIGLETIKFLETGIYQNQQIPPDTIIQWNTWASPFISPKINDYLSLKEPSSLFAAEKMYDFLDSKKEEGILPDWQVPVRDFYCFFTMKIPFKTEDFINENDYDSAILDVMTAKNSTFETLKQAGFFPMEINRDLYTLFMRLILNPGHPEADAFNFFPGNVTVEDEEIRNQLLYRDTLYKQPFTFMSNYVEFDDYYGKAVTFKSLPKEFTAADALEYVGSVKHLNRNQINTPFYYSFVTKKINDKETMALKTKANLTMRQKSFSALSRRNAERQEDIVVYSREVEQGQVSWRSIPIFFLYHKDLKVLNTAVRTLKNSLAQHNIEIQEEYLPLGFFLASLPLNISIELFATDLGRAKTLLSYNCTHLTPVQTDWKGTGTPAIPFLTRRGQLAFVDLWDTSGGMNASVVGPMGQGKSYFVNHLAYNYRSMPDTIVRIIDVGGSYFGLSHLFNGCYIEPSHDKPFSVNPFSNITDIDKDMDFLVNIVDKMIKPSEKCNDQERGLIQMAIRQAYNKKLIDMEITDVKDEIISIAEFHDITEFKRLAIFNLSPWCHGGQYDKFMAGKSVIDLTNKMLVLELGQIKDDKRLMDILLLAYFYQINKEMYNNDPEVKKIKKLVIWDEAWRFTDDEKILEFLEQGAREYRKFNGSLIFITQNISDLLKNAVTKTLKKNSTYLFVFWQPPEEWERIVKDDDLYISEFEKDLYRDTIRTVKGSYSEILVVSRFNGRGIVRLVLPKELYWLYTTDPNEVAMRMKYYEETQDINKAVEMCMEQSGQRPAHATRRK